ncbi:hypothetical protein L4C36_21240 [Photobacterium japonica]|uniref:hypothetical protein n=1 Tax=Photobacterium japonica TaxID=2910235 RepID=UPI003D0CA379
MKKLFKYLGFGLCSIIIFLLAGLYWVSSSAIEQEVNVEPFLAEAIPKLTEWEKTHYQTFMSEKAFGELNSEQWDLLLIKLSSLGQLETVGKEKLIKIKTLSPIGRSSITYVYYRVPVAFSTGRAHIELGLQLSENKLEINRINFLSDILLQ